MDDMPLMYLPDIVEFRALLRERAPDSKLALEVLKEFSDFLDSLASGKFRLRTEKEFASDNDHHTKLCEALAAVSNVHSSQIELVTHSLTKLLEPDHQGIDSLFAIARAGSVGTKMRVCWPHASCLEPAKAGRIPRSLVEHVLKARNLEEVLRLSQYGIGFSRIFANDIVTFFTCLFAHACEGHVEMIERLLPLSKAFRTEIPIGASLPGEPRGKTLKWSVFVK